MAILTFYLSLTIYHVYQLSPLSDHLFRFNDVLAIGNINADVSIFKFQSFFGLEISVAFTTVLTSVFRKAIITPCFNKCQGIQKKIVTTTLKRY